MKKKRSSIILLSFLTVAFVYLIIDFLTVSFDFEKPFLMGLVRYFAPVVYLPILFLLLFNIVCIILGLFQKNKPKVQIVVSIVSIVVFIVGIGAFLPPFLKAHVEVEHLTGEEAQLAAIASLDAYGTFPIDVEKEQTRKSVFDASFYGTEYVESYQFTDEKSLTYYVYVVCSKNSRRVEDMFRQPAKAYYMVDGKPNSYYESEERYCQWIGDNILLEKYRNSISYYQYNDKQFIKIVISTNLDGVEMKSQEELFTLCQAQFEALQKEHAFN